MKNPHALTLSFLALSLFVGQGAASAQSQSNTSRGSFEGDARQGVSQPAQSRPAAQDEASKTARRRLGSIKGRVVGDAGEPLPGVVVFASSRALSPNTFGARAQHYANSDDEGNFSVGGLEPGLYGLTASAPGYVSESDPVTGRADEIYRPGDVATVRLVKGGVVTGSVTDAQGQPLVAAEVRAFRVRDLDGRASDTPYSFTLDSRTDDRGVYRIYGLRPGIYVVSAGGSFPVTFGPASPYGDVPTFYPSSTRDTAAEITVRAGQEAAGVDIHFREDQQGHRVTGRLDAPNAQGEVAASVSLVYASSGMQAAGAVVMPDSPDRAFSIEAVPDGDYDLQAVINSREGLAGASAAQRVSVRGADVTGLRLAITPLASASGALVFEPAADSLRASDACKDLRASLLPQETLISAVADRPPKGGPVSRISALHPSAPDASGAFVLRDLEAGRYRLSPRPFDDSLYVRAVELPATSTTAAATSSAAARTAAAARPTAAAAQAQRANASARDFFDVRAGQQLSGLSVRLAEGAAAFAGHLVAAEGSALPPPSSLRVYLVPAEREHADDTLRFYVTAPGPDGSFSFKNLAPGRYHVVARPLADPTEASPRPEFWDADSRVRLRRDAEAAYVTVELQPCQRATDFALKFPAQSK